MGSPGRLHRPVWGSGVPAGPSGSPSHPQAPGIRAKGSGNGHLVSPRTQAIWSHSPAVCYGVSRWPGCRGSPDEGSFAPLCPGRVPGGRVCSRRRSPPSPGAHQLPGRGVIFLRITRDRVRQTPCGPVVLDRALLGPGLARSGAQVVQAPRSPVRWVSPPNLASRRANRYPHPLGKRVQPAPYTNRLGTLGLFGDGLLG
ncbi:hypothetical protein NDU88_001414 [Pleurodeles waltl]|uniref:Uncharacterized protein n=1 Tax=Pleurodeles waltl TaxID=8319 RepID=A0AAV7NCI5_PLEWA|nr:hypothetical protein NDU88_001414 [Pleurodeles waltl]